MPPQGPPRVRACCKQPALTEQPVGLREAGEAADHLVDLAIADKRNIVTLRRQRDQLQARGGVQFVDAALDHLPHNGHGAHGIQVAERIQQAATRHPAMHAGLSDLDSLFEYGPMQEFRDMQRAIGILRLARSNAGRGETLDQVGHDPRVPVHLHRLRAGPIVVALILAVAAQIAVGFLAGDEVVRHGGQTLADGRIAGAFVGLGGSVEPLTGVLALPSAFAFRHHFGGEELDGVALGAVDVLC